jgi:hypothetical protein
MRLLCKATHCSRHTLEKEELSFHFASVTIWSGDKLFCLRDSNSSKNVWINLA